MAAITTSPAITSSLLPATAKVSFLQNPRRPSATRTPLKRAAFVVQAAKLPVGVQLPKDVPKFQPPFAGFTRAAETWNSRACMIGLIGTFIVELILKKGILEIVGIEIGKGLDIPL